MNICEQAFKSPNVPADIMQMLLNLTEFLERARASISIVELKDLSTLAEKCHAYAKALHYKELEFHNSTSPSAQTIEALIRLNTQLQQPEAAEGILVYAHQKLRVQSKESWLSKLHRWEGKFLPSLSLSLCCQITSLNLTLTYSLTHAHSLFNLKTLFKSTKRSWQMRVLLSIRRRSISNLVHEHNNSKFKTCERLNDKRLNKNNAQK
jgi:hypothetical protein